MAGMHRWPLLLLSACAVCAAAGAVSAPGADDTLRAPVVPLQHVPAPPRDAAAAPDLQSKARAGHAAAHLGQMLGFKSSAGSGTNNNCAACDALLADLQALRQARESLGRLLIQVAGLAQIGPSLFS